VSFRIEIPYVNLAAQHKPIKGNVLDAIGRVIDSGQFILGDEVGKFEKRFAELCGVNFAVSVNSGTDALILALRSLGIGQGDEVITVPNSFIASTSCITLVGAKPVFIDVREDYNMDSGRIKEAITSRTKAILPVHLTGRPADMAPIMQVAHEYNLHVVEDCAQAVLAKYRGQKIGSFGIVNCFSLHPLKTLNACGDGGILTTNDEAIYERIKNLRNLGLQTRDNCVAWSGNSRLDTIQAAILLVKLEYLEEWTIKRRSNARFYHKNLDHLESIVCPSEKEHEFSVYHTFVIQAARRDELKVYLAKRGIETAIHYPKPIHLHTVASDLGYKKGDFPVAERQSQRILSLPVYPELNTADLRYVVDSITEFYHNRNH